MRFIGPCRPAKESDLPDGRCGSGIQPGKLDLSAETDFRGRISGAIIRNEKSDMSPRTKKEKRLYPRRPIRTQVVFENEDSEGVLYFFSKDISAGGLFLES